MSSAQQQQMRTRMFARVLGPFLVIVCIIAALRSNEMSPLLSDFAANASWSWVAGPLILIGGLTMIAKADLWTASCLVFAALGLYRCYAGWVPATHRPATPSRRAN